ncbi:MAG: SpoIID/LytB domain-containing protein [Firmicutes bacterium]|nr:SpoIID/LytB domain-containing protein [Bacillota bacterium]MDD4264294.1 SpoIID/LytB domain-containing protein [Bacillota bacterium]MDD4693768.1 SpoIID/LytB domain-containing protein [Bacillota bacterium]
MKKSLIMLFFVCALLAGCGKKDDLPKQPTISLYLTESGKTKNMPIEEYLYGVVAGEMLPNWPREAYAAQAIIARTFTMEFLERGGLHDKYGTDLSDDITETQAYNPDDITDAIKEAVDKTRGLVAKFDGHYIKGWFHAFSGGETTTAKVGLNYAEDEPQYIKVAIDPGVEYAPPDNRNWEATYSYEELTNLLREKGHIDFAVTGVSIGEKNDQGRVTQFIISGEGDSGTIPGAEFRIAVDSTKLKSIWVASITETSTGVVFSGKGYGHGVGMSQWGAYALAEQGKSSQEIVKHFFDEIEIVQAYR